MGFFVAIEEVKRMRREGYPGACMVECIPGMRTGAPRFAERYSIAFKNAAELAAFRTFNRNWDIGITEIDV